MCVYTNVPSIGSGSNKTLRSHKPIGKDRDEAHAIAVVVGEDEIVHHAEVKRGSASIHDGTKDQSYIHTYVHTL